MTKPQAQPKINIAALATTDMAELHNMWQTAFGQPPPPRLGRDLLMRAIAWHGQIQQHGALRPALRRKLAQLAGSHKARPFKTGSAGHSLKPGTRLMREWKGRTETVEVTTSGFLWQDKTYRSLSAVARAITGGRWSGPRFFGLEGR